MQIHNEKQTIFIVCQINKNPETYSSFVKYNNKANRINNYAKFCYNK